MRAFFSGLTLLALLGACTPSYVTDTGERAYLIEIPFGSQARDDDLEDLTRLEREQVWRSRLLDQAESLCSAGHKVVKGPSFKVRRHRIGTISIPLATGGFTQVQRALPSESKRITEIVCTDDGLRPAYEPRLAAEIAQAETAYATLEPVNLGRKTLLIGVSDDRQMAVVLASDRTDSARFVEIEAAVAQRSGCQPRFTGPLGQLLGSEGDSFVGTNKFVNSIGLDRSHEIRLSLTCSDQDPPAGSSEVARFTGSTAPKQSDPAFPRADTTYLFHSRDHGYEISYFGADGRYWFWYPGNQQLLLGSWQRRGTEFCSTSDQPSYNPALKRVIQGEKCLPAIVASQFALDAVPGDPLALATGTLPYRRARCDAPEVFTFDRSQVTCTPTRP